MSYADEKIKFLAGQFNLIYQRANREIRVTWDAYMKECGKEVADLQQAFDMASTQQERNSIGYRLRAAKRKLTLYDKHYKNMVKNIADRLHLTNVDAANLVNNQLNSVFIDAYNRQSLVTSQSIMGYSFQLIDTETVEYLVKTGRTLLPYKTINRKKDVRWNTGKINAEVMQGIIQGEPMDKIANRFERVLNMNQTSAMRNARTATLSAREAGEYQSIKKSEEQGVLYKKYWVCTHDEKTRPSHKQAARRYDKAHAIDTEEMFHIGRSDMKYARDPNGRPEDVYNCRCRTIYTPMGFKSTLPQELQGKIKVINK